MPKGSPIEVMRPSEATVRGMAKRSVSGLAKCGASTARATSQLVTVAMAAPVIDQPKTTIVT